MGHDENEQGSGLLTPEVADEENERIPGLEVNKRGILLCHDKITVGRNPVVNKDYDSLPNVDYFLSKL